MRDALHNATYIGFAGTPIDLIIKIKGLMLDYKYRLRNNYEFYSQDLLDNLFKHPYTKIEFIVNDIGY
jgi:hypothetical protein